MVPLGVPSNTLGLHERPGRGRARREVWGRRRIRSAHLSTKPTGGCGPSGSSADPNARRPGAGRPRRRAVESISARHGYGPAVSRCRHAGLHRRLPRLGLHRHAARKCRPTSSGRRTMGISLFAGEAEERRLDEVLRDAWRWRAQAAVQLHGRAARAWKASRRPSCRASTSQRTVGHCPSIDLGRGCPYSARSAPSSTCRAARAASARPTTWRKIMRENYAAGHQAVLHHRRQLRPQPATGRRSSTA